MRGDVVAIFGKAVKGARDKAGLSQEEASKLIEEKYNVRLSSTYLSMIESGARKNLTVNVISAISTFFKLSAADVLSLLDLSSEKTQGFYEDKETEPWLELMGDMQEKGVPFEGIKKILTVYAESVYNIRKSTSEK